MKINKPKILIISSANPLKGPGVMASDIYKAYKKYGYEADVLTKFKCEKYPEFLYIYENAKDEKKLSNRLTHYFFYRIYEKLRRIITFKPFPKGSYTFFYRKEEDPPISIDKVLNKITKNYDLVQIIFWQGLLSFATVQAIYRKLNCLFYFSCVDYSPMSGGCHFVGDCERYKVGCGCCPAYNSKNPQDFTWHNVNYRKKVYDEVDPIVTGNSYMFGFYDQSILLKDRKRVLSSPIIDTSIFKPYPKDYIKKKLNISIQKDFLILFGCQGINDERKGIKYLIEGINIFTKKLSDQQRKRVLIMSIGQSFESIRSQFAGIDTLDLGYVSQEELARIYSVADVFLCSSVNDAGPMMVNQALCCGTPVVGFEMGACLDAVKDKGTGYCARLRDTDDYANGIHYIYNLTDEQRKSMSNTCVKLALDTYTYKAAVDRIIGAYYSCKRPKMTY